MVHEDRVVVLVDMDCFYCQVEENLNPSLFGKPIAVVQYNAWRGGGIIAVNYPARDRGVTRHMRGAEAKKICPEINLVTVPNVRGKADLTKYREAGKKVADVLQTFTPLLERASVDEAYLDITAAVESRIDNMVTNLKPQNYTNTYVVGSNIEDFLHNVYSDISVNNKNLKLAVGAFITEQIRAAVYAKTGYRCSAGIAHNKILAKLVCGLNKPNKQTILSEEGVNELYKDLPLKKIKSLGGKFGLTVIEKLGITTMGELSQFSETKLQQHFDDKTANWLYNIAKGIDHEPVTKRLISKSIGCCKKFPGKTALKTEEDITHWLHELAEEVCERLEKDCQENNRKAKQAIVTFVQQIKDKEVSGSRTVTLTSYDKNKMVSIAFDAIKKNCQLPNGSFHLKLLGISACNFEEKKNVREITSFFKHFNNTVSNSSLICNFNSDESVEKNSASEIMCVSETVESNNIEDNLQIKKDENENDDNSDDSVYSASTEELIQNIEELQFYPDEHRLKPQDILVLSDQIKSKSNTNELVLEEKIDSNNFSNNFDNENILGNECVSADEENSIENELSIVKDNEQLAGSFFKTWLNSKSDSVKSPVERSFDTSVILQEISDNDSDDKENDLDESNDSNQSKILPLTVLSNDTEICTECNKSILIAELQSHMDYHYALKIVKEESKLHAKRDIESSTPNKNKGLSNKNVKSGKRKRDIKENSKKSTITKFFVNNDITANETYIDGLYEICGECKKNVKVKELSSHMDYHAAKRLHIEINSIKLSSQQSTKTENKNKKPKKDTKMNTVTSYFKPL